MYVYFNNFVRLYKYKLKSAVASYFPMSQTDYCNNLEKVIIYTIKSNNEFMFINAWNKWGENMFIEPSNEYGFTYLEILYNLLVKHTNK